MNYSVLISSTGLALMSLLLSCKASFNTKIESKPKVGTEVQPGTGSSSNNQSNESNQNNQGSNAGAVAFSVDLSTAPALGFTGGDGTAFDPFVFGINAGQTASIKLTDTTSPVVITCSNLPAWVTLNQSLKSLELAPSNDDLGDNYQFSCSMSSGLALTSIVAYFKSSILEASMSLLSGPMVDGGEAESFKVKGDESYIVFIADKDTDGLKELYSTNMKGETVKISGAMQPNATIYHYVILENSDFALYVADAETDNMFELWKAPLDGSSAPVKLNAAMQANGDVSANPNLELVSFRVSPNETFVIYGADAVTDNSYELFMVNMDGTGHRKLNEDYATGAAGNLYNFMYSVQFTEDFVAYTADADIDGKFELYGVDFNNLYAVTKISDPSAIATALVSWVTLAPGDRVVYAMDVDTDDCYQLYIANRDGSGGPTRINPDLGSCASSVYIRNITVIPSLGKVVYIANNFGASLNRVYSVNLDGSNHQEISHPTPHSSARVTTSFNSLLFSEDSSKVYYIGDMETSGAGEIYAASIDGSTHTKISGTITAGSGPLQGGIDFSTFGIGARSWLAESSGKFLYESEQDFAGRRELYHSALDGSNNQKIWTAPFAGAGVYKASSRWTPDHSRVVFAADNVYDDVVGLYSVNPDGTDLIQINQPQSSAYKVIDPDDQVYVTKNSKNVIFILEDANAKRHLYLSGVTGAPGFANKAPRLDGISDIYTPTGAVITTTDVGKDFLDDFDRDGDAITYQCFFDANQDLSVSEDNACSEANLANGTGFNFNSATGEISGWTPATVVGYEFKIKGCDTKNLCGETIFNLYVHAPCAGTYYAGGCWYQSTDSCTNYCASRGGYSALTETYAGSSGSMANCEALLGVLGKSVSSISLDGTYSFGCYYNSVLSPVSYKWAGTVTTDPDADPTVVPFSNITRICACNN